MNRPVLGRRPDPVDERDHVFGIAAIVTPLTSYYYARPYPVVIDQADTPDCVGYSGASYRASEERRDEARTLVFDGADLYELAKQIDGYPLEDGTDIRSAAKQLVSIGGKVIKSPVASEVGARRKIGSYSRLTSIDAILGSIQKTGGAWLGSSWYESWFSPVNGVLPAPDKVAGGHAYRAIGWKGYVPSNPLATKIRCINSWGTNWGQNGLFWLPASYVDFSDFDCWTTIDIIGDK